MAGTDDPPLAPFGDSIVHVFLAGEPGLIPHILAMGVKDCADDPAALLTACRAVFNWLQTDTRGRDLAASEPLWKTLMAHYFPKAPKPPVGTMTTRGWFIAMSQRNMRFVQDSDRHHVLHHVYTMHAQTERDAHKALRKFPTPKFGDPEYDNEEDRLKRFRLHYRAQADYRRATRERWEAEQSAASAKSDKEWSEQFLSVWNPMPQAPPLRRQDAEFVPAY